MKNIRVKLVAGENTKELMSQDIDWSDAVNNWAWVYAWENNEWVWVDWDEVPQYFDL